MAAVKMNMLHLHLTEDQGFRIESKRFPKLQQLGSEGKYYTQDEVRQIVQYATDRGIRIVPEFDMSGHTTSWLIGCPELQSKPARTALSTEASTPQGAHNRTTQTVSRFSRSSEDGSAQHRRSTVKPRVSHDSQQFLSAVSNGRNWRLQPWKPSNLSNQESKLLNPGQDSARA